MRILTRYILRAHVGPFLFAFTALTALLFLNAIAQRLENLVGKGLPWDVVLEFAILSLPHTVALTLPMSVLVAVLYAFSDLTANSEVTAMSAGGVKPSRILVPVLVAGTILSLGMLYFNDQILPEANHRLKNLTVDVANKSPTFELEEQVVNEIRTGDGNGRYFLRAARIDRQSNDLFDVSIHDVTSGPVHRTTYADSGSMAFNAEGTDLYLTLYDGVVLESDDESPGGFQRVMFERQVVPLRGVGDVLQRETGSTQRGEREMSIALLRENVERRQAQRQQVLSEVRQVSRTAVLSALGLDESGTAAAPEGTEAASDDSDAASDAVSDAAAGTPSAARPPRGRSAAVIPVAATIQREPDADRLTQRTAARVRTQVNQADALVRQAKQYEVEIHKKYTIAFACLVFVLIGAPIAVRFPRGGVGMSIAVSVGVFGIYWMGLIGGENLADRGALDPFVAMWTPNILFFLVGVFMSTRLSRWVATSRGGGWSDMLRTTKDAVLHPVKHARDARATR